MNQETIIQVMKFMHDTCVTNETCKNCIFGIKDATGCTECGLVEIPSTWKLNEPRAWKAFKE